MSVRDFAEHLGVAIRTVSKWENRGENIALQPGTQSMLDVALERSPDDVRSRFSDLVEAPVARAVPAEAGAPPSVVVPVLVDGRVVLMPLPSSAALLSMLPGGRPDETPSAGSPGVEIERRRALGALALGAAALALPEERPGRFRVGMGEAEAVLDMVGHLSRMDQRRGGGHARSAAVEYFTTHVAPLLDGNFHDENVRRAVFSAAGELAYLAGWMAFDSGEHEAAWRDFRTAVQLAEEAGDAPLAGHVLRAMAHQAVDLGQPSRALQLAQGSVDGDRYAAAAPRERALLGVVHARALASAGRDAEAAAALNRAEDDLAAAESGDEEPARVFFFGEASLAHETACALRDLGDLAGAGAQFTRSIRTRNTSTFTRTHAVTLGYLGSVQLRQGDVDAACDSWSSSLDAMQGVDSGRTRQVVLEMRSALAPFRRAKLPAARDLDARATDYLDTVSAAVS
ncbi:Tat pathway signal protein [Jiangella anatolica]|nr:Tat pathway signal protein [Jiangella anatolica]